MVVTITARKERKADALRLASRQVMAELADYAHRHGGRFLVFGSAARDELRSDSDFDVVIDFPEASIRCARDFVEEACSRAGIRPDAHEMPGLSEALLKRVRRDAVVLS